LKRIINTPTRGIGKQTLAELEDFAHRNNFSLFETLAHVEMISLSQRSTKALLEFYQLIQQYSMLHKTLSFEEWSRVLIDGIGIRNYYKDMGGEEAHQRLSNIDELLNDISEYCHNNSESNLESYLEEVSLITDIDTWEDEKNAVSLMTLHSAKGLEFPVVFICGLNQGLLPLERETSEAQIEEERRLFYVGLTRAKEKIFLSNASTRLMLGELQLSQDSIFLREIPADLIQANNFQKAVISTTRRSRKSIKRSGDIDTRQAVIANTGSSEAKVGRSVVHKIFGIGKILGVTGTGVNARLQIHFREVGPKTIIAKYIKVI
jgi:DNA helicase-2/ATP-dependent DNA helicase PcrA